MGEKGLSGAAGDDSYDDDAIEPAVPDLESPDRAWMPEREPAFASGDAEPAAAAPPPAGDAPMPDVAVGG